MELREKTLCVRRNLGQNTYFKLSRKINFHRHNGVTPPNETNLLNVSGT